MPRCRHSACLNRNASRTKGRCTTNGRSGFLGRVVAGIAASLAMAGVGLGFAQEPNGAKRIQLAGEVRARCLDVLREGIRGDDFWPAIHAAEGLTIGGRGEEVIELLAPRLPSETDDQRRCGLARELVRAGRKQHAAVMLEILAGANPHGHVHSAESLYKVNEIGDGAAMRQAAEQTANVRLRLMAAAALAKCGSDRALPIIREQLATKDEETLRIAAWILGRVGESGDIERLKKEQQRAQEPLTRAYIAHSLATLGDADGLKQLAENLRSDDAAIRTYAATFAGDARAVDVAARLIEMLDDPHPDARIRAAQSLLDLANPPPDDPADRAGPFSDIVFAADKLHPRYTEGSIAELADGRLLLAVTEFQESGSDFAKAHIVARESADGGRTWSETRVLQKNVGGMNVMSVTLRRLGPPNLWTAPLGMFYLVKNRFDSLEVRLRISNDDGKTFGDPIEVSRQAGYHVMNNDRVTRLSTGRWLAPVAFTADVQKVNHFVSFCCISDDEGQTWRRGRGEVDLPKRGAMEPEVIELRDGRVLMIARTQLGKIAAAHSTDGGDTWGETFALDVQAPEAPATLRRIPATGDLLLVWNNTFSEGAGHGGRRTPLTAAISSDEGKTWQNVRNIEYDRERTFSYVSLLFVGPRFVMSYWDQDARGYHTRFRSQPVRWLYDPPHP